MLAPILLSDQSDFDIGALRVKPRSLEVVIKDVVFVLEPRVMQALIALAHRPNEVVTHKDLLDLCWEGRIVSRDAVQRCVYEIRKLISSGAGFRVETIARQGYRLVVSAEKSDLLAVLPFTCEPTSEDNRFYAEGLSTEILSLLTRFDGARVVGRLSTYRFRAGDKGAPADLAASRVTHILQGSMTREGDRVAVVASLRDAVTNEVLWSEHFQRTAQNALDLQAAIAGAVARTLGFETPANIAAPTLVDPALLELYGRAQESALDLSVYSSRRAGAYLAEVTLKAPDFAPAWGLMARTYAISRWGESPQTELELRAAAKRAAERALALDPLCGAAHAALYYLEPPAGNFLERERRLHAAMSANPTDQDIRGAYYMHLFNVGRLSEGFALARESFDLDPLSLTTGMRYALALFGANRSRESLELLVRLNVDWPSAPNVLGAIILFAAFAEQWDLVELYSDPARAASIAPLDRIFIQRTSAVAVMLRTRAAEAEVVQRILSYERSGGVVLLSQLGFLALLGHTEEAYDIAERSSFAPYFDPSARLEPHDGLGPLFFSSYANLRASPRFVGICARLGLVEYWSGVGHWPDCAHEVPYDFAAACTAAVG